jgi:hypothetical protein
VPADAARLKFSSARAKTTKTLGTSTYNVYSPLTCCPYWKLADSTVARSWRGMSANPTIKFRNLAKNSAIFLAFRSYMIKLVLKTKTVLFALFPLNKVVV